LQFEKLELYSEDKPKIKQIMMVFPGELPRREIGQLTLLQTSGARKILLSHLTILLVIWRTVLIGVELCDCLRIKLLDTFR